MNGNKFHIKKVSYSPKLLIGILALALIVLVLFLSPKSDGSRSYFDYSPSKPIMSGPGMDIEEPKSPLAAAGHDNSVVRIDPIKTPVAANPAVDIKTSVSAAQPGGSFDFTLWLLWILASVIGFIISIRIGIKNGVYKIRTKLKLCDDQARQNTK